jgi:V8-like Glu-specific endopeptidase
MSDIIGLIEATVRLEQPLPNQQSTVGTGFVVVDHRPDGAPRTVLITANHVFQNMPRDSAQVGFRRRDAAGAWRYAPIKVRLRDAAGEPLWTRHPTQDVAAIELPDGVAPSALPLQALGGQRVLEAIGIEPGDEMMVLGYPDGVSANAAGFPILRAGRVASYPLSPADRYPTYLVDFNVFGGNSGGPVYALAPSGPLPQGASGRAIVVTGLLTQQIESRGQRLAIGNVTQADFITETLSLLNGGPAPVTLGSGSAQAPEMSPVSDSPALSSVERLKEAWRAFAQDLELLVRRAWIVAREAVLDWTTEDPKRVA